MAKRIYTYTYKEMGAKEARAARPGGRYRQVWRIMRRSPLTITGITIGLAFVTIVILAPVIVPYPKDVSGEVTNLPAKLQPPSPQHFFGTDDLGRDILSRTLYGTRLSLGLGLAVVGITATLGVVLGSIAGYFGGTTDEIIMRTGDILMSIPSLLLAIALIIATGRGLGKLVFALSLPWWPWYARVIRGEIIRIRDSVFVEAARALGCSHGRILFAHIFRNIVGVVIVQASLQVGRAILAVAAMGFLGLGVQPPQVEWGLMVSIGRVYMPTWWWMATFPGVAIFLLGFGFNLFGDGLRDALDPRMTRLK